MSAYHFWFHSLATSVVMLAAVFSRTVFVPSGPQLNYALPLGLILPAVAAAVTTHGTGSRADYLARQSARSSATLVGFRLVAGTLIPMGMTIGVSTALFRDGSYGAVLARNYALCLGFALLATRILGSSWFWLPLSSYVIACMVVGVTATGGLRPWAVLAQPTLQPATTTTTGAILAGGCAVFVATLRRSSSQASLT